MHLLSPWHFKYCEYKYDLIYNNNCLHRSINIPITSTVNHIINTILRFCAADNIFDYDINIILI